MSVAGKDSTLTEAKLELKANVQLRSNTSEWMSSHRLESRIARIPDKSQFLIQSIFMLRFVAKKPSGRMFLRGDLLLKIWVQRQRGNMFYLHSFENSIRGKKGQYQFPAGGTFSWRHCRARSVHFISCSLMDSVVPPVSRSGSRRSLSGIATSSYGSLSSRQTPSIKSKILSLYLSVHFLLLYSCQVRSARNGFLPGEDIFMETTRHLVETNYYK